jgi:hypothetical protein
MEPQQSIRVHTLKLGPSVYDRILSRLNTSQLPVDVINCAQRISNYQFHSVGIEYLKQHMAQEITKRLLEGGYINFNIENTHWGDDKTITAKIKVVKEDE